MRDKFAITRKDRHRTRFEARRKVGRRFQLEWLEARTMLSVSSVGGPPELAAIADRTTTGPLSVALSATDPDGDPLSFSASLVDQAYYLDQSLGLVGGGYLHFDWGGRQDKWLQGSGGAWYFLLPDGSLHRWDGGSGADGPLVATLDPAYYADTSRLADAQPEPVPASASVSGSTLTVTPQAGYSGQFVAVASVNDGRGGSDSHAFLVTVIAQAGGPPVLASPPDQIASVGSATLIALGSFDDPHNGLDAWSVDVDWGDGTPLASFATRVKGSLGTLSHTFADDRAVPYDVTVRLTGPGGSAARTFRVSVPNVAPTASLAGFDSTEAGQPTRFQGTATDPSPADMAAGFLYTWSFGDGTPSVSGMGLTTPIHIYSTSGDYTVQLVVTDRDGAASQAAVARVVVGVASQLGAPSSFKASVRSASRVDLEWSRVATGATNIIVERSPDGASGWVPIATLGADAVTFSDTGLTSSTFYSYRVRAKGPSGYSGYSASASATTLVASTLGAPVNLRTTATMVGSITVDWDANSSDATGFQLSYSADGTTWNDTYYGTTAADVTSYTFYYLVEGSKNYFRVRAVDAQSGVSPWSDVEAAFTKLKSPVAVSLDALGPRRAFLSWRNQTAQATGYEIRTALTGTANWTSTIISADASGATVTNLEPGTAYDFQVRAIGVLSSSDWSTTLKGTAPAESVPAVPTTVTATAIGTGRIDVHFAAAAGADTYEIQRSPDETSGWASSGTISADFPAFMITGLAPGSTAYFRVRAINGSGASAWSAPTSATTASGAVSVTGYDPHFLFDAAQYADLRRMMAEQHPYWQRIKRIADLTGTPNADYGDYGQAAAIAYQVTGDPAYAAKVVGPYLDQLENPQNGYVSRIYLAQMVVFTDWVWSGLTPVQQTRIVDAFNSIADVITDPFANDKNVGLTLSDSDEVIGEWMGVALVDLFPYNPRKGTRLGGELRDSRTGTWIPMGGLTSTGADQTTWRNAITLYCQWAEGGAWFESAEYNMDTIRLTVFGAEAINSFVGAQMFPDVQALAEGAAMVEMYRISPDLTTLHQWGDEEHPRVVNAAEYVNTLMVLSGAVGRGSAIQPYLDQIIQDLGEKYGYDGYNGTNPYGPAYLFYSPYRPKADWRTLPPAYFAKGQGLLLVRDIESNTLLAFHTMRKTNLDHSMNTFGDFQYYRHGEWVLTHPLGYTARAYENDVYNSMLIAGLGAAGEVQRAVAQEAASDGSYAYLASETYGNYYGPSAYNPPPVYLHEWTRSEFYLASADGKSDAVITFDRVDAEDPRNQTPADQMTLHWNQGEINKIDAAPSLTQWFFHTPTHSAIPTVSGSTVNWTTDGGQQVQLRMFLPSDATVRVDDEQELYKDYAIWPQGWRIAISPTTDTEWTTGLSVLTTSDPGTDAPVETSIKSTSGEAAQGVLLQRSGSNDALVMFGAVAKPLQRLLTEGYTASWSQATSTADLYLVDLDPSRTWSYSVDGGAPTTFSVSPEGVGRLSVAGVGDHAIRISAS